MKDLRQSNIKLANNGGDFDQTQSQMERNEMENRLSASTNLEKKNLSTITESQIS